VPVASLVDAMREHGIAVELVDIPADGVSSISDRRLVLARTDQHVAWRGNAIPDRPQHLVDTLRGRAYTMVIASQR
jgi:hypothetical protein